VPDLSDPAVWQRYLNYIKNTRQIPPPLPRRLPTQPPPRPAERKPEHKDLPDTEVKDDTKSKPEDNKPKPEDDKPKPDDSKPLDRQARDVKTTATDSAEKGTSKLEDTQPAAAHVESPIAIARPEAIIGSASSSGTIHPAEQPRQTDQAMPHFTAVNGQGHQQTTRAPSRTVSHQH